jgi:hypothetical protein
MHVSERKDAYRPLSVQRLMIIFQQLLSLLFRKLFFSKFFMNYNRSLQAGAFRIVSGKVLYVTKVSGDIVSA